MAELGMELSGVFYPQARLKRQKMVHHCNFGKFGTMKGQFIKPTGVAVNAQNDIVVSDTSNHRIQVFDKQGRFKFQFGQCSDRSIRLFYPKAVGVNRKTGEIVVIDILKWPENQIKVYDQYGQFKLKFGADLRLRLCCMDVDSNGHIVVMECAVMRLIIFDKLGNVSKKFSCSHYLQSPNDVCTNDKQEIFISDNCAHCIKVFNYDGLFLRQLGGEGITNYPIGVGINALGEVVVADNHNYFNLTIFQQDGTMLSALESKVKHTVL